MQFGSSSQVTHQCGPPALETSTFAAKLQRFVALSPEEHERLNNLVANHQVLPAGSPCFTRDRANDAVLVIASGIAFRYKLSPSGSRQILGFIVAGDLVEPYFSASAPTDYDVGLLTDCDVLTVSRRALLSLVDQCPAIERAISLCAVYEQNILREWLLNLGQRNASDRVSYLLAEMAMRLRAVGFVNDDGSVDLPISQSMLADTTGLTLVHINRTLQQLRALKLVEIGKRRITISNAPALLASLDFDPEYLCCERRRSGS